MEPPRKPPITSVGSPFQEMCGVSREPASLARDTLIREVARRRGGGLRHDSATPRWAQRTQAYLAALSKDAQSLLQGARALLSHGWHGCSVGLRLRAPRSPTAVEHPLVVSRSASGGAFHLDRASTVDAVEHLAQGWTGHVTAGSTQLVVRGPAKASSYDEALVEAVSAAQESLDLLAMRGVQARAIESVDSDHLVWWTDPTGRRLLRILTVSDLGVSMSASGTVTDSEGRVKPPPAPPTLPWHESLRYFRLAQVTGDLFDAYRNMYLAFESLLSSVVPQNVDAAGKPNENERQWLLRALTKVDGVLSLAPYAPPGHDSAVDRVLNDLYAGTRTQLFHAKSGRPVLLPHGLTSREAVIESLTRLSRLFLDLFNHHFGFTPPSGGLTYAGFGSMTSYDATAVLSDDSSPVNKADTDINPGGGSSVTMQAHRSEQLSKPGLTFWMAEEPLGNRDDLTDHIVRRVGLVNREGMLIQVQRLLEPVALSGIDVLQVQQGARLVNRQEPRFRFAT